MVLLHRALPGIAVPGRILGSLVGLLRLGGRRRDGTDLLAVLADLLRPGHHDPRACRVGQRSRARVTFRPPALPCAHATLEPERGGICMNLMRWTLGISAVALAGCGGPQSIGTPNAIPRSAAMSPTTHGFLLHQPRNPRFVFVSESQDNNVTIFTPGRHPKKVGMITEGISGPFQIAIDKRQTLYVANSANGTVTEYPAGQLSPSVTLTGIFQPAGIAVDSEGTVFVSSYYGDPEISAFKRGQSIPFETISGIPALGLAVDSHDNLFVGAQTKGVYEVPTGTTTPRNLTLRRTGSVLNGFVFGVALNAADDVFVADCKHLGSILVYHAGGTKPFRTITHHAQCPGFINVGALDQRLYAPFRGSVAVYKPGESDPFAVIDQLKARVSATSGRWPTP